MSKPALGTHTTLRTTHNPSPSAIDTFLNILSNAYLNTPLTTAFISEIDATPPPYSSQSITPARLKQHFSLGINAVSKSNILLTFAYPSDPVDTSSFSTSQKPLVAALFEPPSFTGTPPSDTRDSPGPILTEYRDLSRTLRTKHLSIPETGPRAYEQPAAPSQSSAGPSEDPWPGKFNKDEGAEIRGFYQLAFMVKNPDVDQEEAAIAVRELVAEYQVKAGAEDVPVWLLASAELGMLEYQDMGFKVVDSEVVGKGRVDGDGWPSEDDKAVGVRVWAMIWEP